MQDEGKLQELSTQIRESEDGLIIFADKILGLPVSKHMGQVRWLKNSRKTINILRPANRYGKTLIGAVKHVYHHFTKINMDGMYNSVEEWLKLKYDTLNFGPGYEQAREILRMAKDIIQGDLFIPKEFQKEYGVYNNSLLKDWFITEDKVDAAQLPYLKFWSGGSLLARSYDDMGAAFKMKGLAYISGDEVGDIRELWSFTNGTLLPRLAQYKKGAIDYYGTPQPEGHDYMRMIEMAEEDMLKPEWRDKGMFYVQKGTMYENPFLDKDTVDQIEKIADPTLKRQILYGEYTETGEKYFGYERIWNSVDPSLKQIDKGLPGRKYLLVCDFAGGESSYADYSVFVIIDYTNEPYKVVHVKRFKGGNVSIPLQYKLVEELFNDFLASDPETGVASQVRLIIDGSALGGKNALAFLRHLNPITYTFSPTLKAELLATLKIAFDGGQSKERRRDRQVTFDGRIIENNPDWGLLRIPDLPFLYNELINYKLDDKKIKTDCVMVLGMALHYLGLRRPKQQHRKMVDFDLLQII